MPDGRIARIEVPEGTTPEQAQSMAASVIPSSAPAAPAPKGPKQYQGLQSSQALDTYTKARDSLLKTVSGKSDFEQKRALTRFDADPRIQGIRKAAGLAEVRTKQEELKDIGRRQFEQSRAAREKSIIPQLPGSDFLNSFRSSVANTFGIGDRIAALPASMISGRSYGDELEILREQGRLERGQSFAGDVAGMLYGGAGVTQGVQGAANVASRSAKPALQKAGNVLQNLTTLKKGQRVRNVGKMALGGAAGGGAQAIGEGSDVSDAVLIGAVGAPAIAGAGKAAVATGKFLRNTAGFEPVEQIIGRYVTTPVSEIADAMAKRQKQGLDSTVYEVLPLQDRQALDDAIARMPAKARERVASLVNTRASEMVTETSGRVQEIIRPTGPEKIRSQIATDLAKSRGELPTQADMALAERAARSPLEMREVRRQESSNIMKPYDKLPAFNSVSDLVPQAPENVDGTIIMRETNPEIGATIRRAANVLRIKEDALTFSDVTKIMSHLSKQQGRGGIEGDAAATALNHVSDVIAEQHPKVAPAITKMREVYAARRRMGEGVTEGARTRRRVDVDESTPGAARKALNAYDTPEGTAGRALGQAQQLERDLLASPKQSLRALEDIANNPTQRLAISENLGNNAGENIADVARMQSQSARRLSGLDRETAERGGSSLDLMQNLMMLGPSTLPVTKIRAVTNLIEGTLRIPENQAQQLSDMLFSTNPAQISRAISAISKYGNEGGKLIRSIGLEVGLGSTLASNMPEEGPVSDIPDPVISETPPEVDTEMLVDGDSPYAAPLQEILANESPELVDLIQRQAMQESGGRQFDDNGNPITSSAGAIGIMQVMPGTGPEAARMAGVPWDENAYYTDQNYNMLLGVAYLSEMLNRFDGDVEKALAAYNAGPGRLEQALARNEENWLDLMPAETQNYVVSILS